MAKTSKRKLPLKHGGARPNAGRKPLLSVSQMLDVGGLCERKWLENSELTAEERVMNQRDLPDRHAGRLATLKGRKVSHLAYEKAGNEVFKARTRHYRLRRKRPHGGDTKADIIDAAISYSLSEYGITLTPRMVIRIWQEFRAVQRRLDADRDV